MFKKVIANLKTDVERAFYGSKNIEYNSIQIDGPVDGESAFKECQNIDVINSVFNLRYPLWHNSNLKVNSCLFGPTCRAGMWYVNKGSFNQCNCFGVKAFRECNEIYLGNSIFNSDEIFWRCHNVNVEFSSIKSVYAFFESTNITLNHVSFSGKYSFQYVKDAVIENCQLDTKDAFWHSENVTVKNCTVKGEYLGWYSKNLTLINCKITGTQPLCYCENLTIENCSFVGCDLAFENSVVNGNITGPMESIKNPKDGKLLLDTLTTYISDDFDLGKGKFQLLLLKK